MSRLLVQLLKHNAVRVEGGVIVPTTDRKPMVRVRNTRPDRHVALPSARRNKKHEVNE